ncbi:MAG: CDP-diacylglycerol--serine O-phosphatidyltransferase [Vicinamibacteria bacterium]|jgi:CDP-diacylglycerol--serine O-phosphatidyltransferase|nr:CDP-diacylglycerol--serine O-phosphatidyltransferase [Vicinamibacteria bacterium]
MGPRIERFRRGGAILPALFTVGNLFLGFWSIVKALHGDFGEAAMLIFWAGVADALDGRIARMTGTTSEFGGELDSLCDVISFGVAPAILVYTWALSAIPRAGWLAAFLFVMCGTLRLARFNVQRHVVDGRFFVGLPIPAAAGQVAAVVMFAPEPLSERVTAIPVMVLVVMLAFLMVSTLRYRSFKGVDLRRRQSYIAVLGVAILFLAIALHPASMLLAMASAYSLSGPTGHLMGLLRRRGEPPPPAPAEAH